MAIFGPKPTILEKTPPKLAPMLQAATSEFGAKALGLGRAPLCKRWPEWGRHRSGNISKTERRSAVACCLLACCCFSLDIKVEGCCNLLLMTTLPLPPRGCWGTDRPTAGPNHLGGTKKRSLKRVVWQIQRGFASHTCRASPIHASSLPYMPDLHTTLPLHTRSQQSWR